MIKKLIKSDKMKATINVVKKLYASGHEEDVDEKMTLTEAQSFVGGDIEYVRSRIPRRALVVNEEGTLDDLPTNRKATEATHPTVLMLDGIRGDALLVKA